MNTYKNDPAKGLSKLQIRVLEWIFSLPTYFDPELIPDNFRPVNTSKRRPDYKPRKTAADIVGLDYKPSMIMKALFKAVHPSGSISVDRDTWSRAMRRLEQRGLIIRLNRLGERIESGYGWRQTAYIITTPAAEEWHENRTRTVTTAPL